MSAIRPMIAADKPPVITLLRQTRFFTEEEIQVAEELIDLYLNDGRQTDYRLVVIEHEQTVAG